MFDFDTFAIRNRALRFICRRKSILLRHLYHAFSHKGFDSFKNHCFDIQLQLFRRCLKLPANNCLYFRLLRHREFGYPPADLVACAG